MVDHVRDKHAQHYVAALHHEMGIQAGNRQPRYFSHARPGFEETRGVPFDPAPKIKPRKTSRR